MSLTEVTKQMLQQYYNLNYENIPQTRIKSQWENENKVGFLFGILTYGLDDHIAQLHQLLLSEQFKDQENIFIDSMFDYYIRPFHKSYNTTSEGCHTPSSFSLHSSTSNSVEDLTVFQELTHSDLKKTLLKRDGVCLFCWNIDTLKCSHIIAQKNTFLSNDLSSIFKRAGLSQKHETQNGLLLCVYCHEVFDLLKRYVDVIEGRFVVKVVNETNDENDDKYNKIIKSIQSSRKVWGNLCKNEANDEMALYFIHDDVNILPNKVALEFHKIACLVWRMAGGAEPDDEYCSDDDDYNPVPVDTAALKRRFNIRDSAETLKNEI